MVIRQFARLSGRISGSYCSIQAKVTKASQFALRVALQFLAIRLNFFAGESVLATALTKVVLIQIPSTLISDMTS